MLEDLNSVKENFLAFYRDQGRMPSYAEVCKIFGYKSKNAAYRLVQKLLDADILAKSDGGRLVPKNLGGLRLLGSIQAGFPTPAEEEVLDTVSLDEYLVTKPQASFLLRVFGESMIDEGIKPDDLVIIERGRTPKNGDIVLAQIDNEWTLKFFEKHSGKVRLVPANKKFPVLYPKTELNIAGVVTSVVRKYL
ncbi:MAG: transcriptional repressor LexA [bacterium]|nr:transcriptional repressor LexA [bacterium]MBU1917487.1 transcriptional repressor LexA [bacterium]